MNKPFKLEQYKAAIRNIKQRGIVVQASFVFGYESDTDDVFENTVKFCREQQIDFIMFHPLNALPGTSLYKEAVKEGRVIRDRFKLEPISMSSYKELEEKVLNSALHFYSFSCIIERLKHAFRKKLQMNNRYPFLKYLISSFAIRAAYKKQLSQL